MCCEKCNIFDVLYVELCLVPKIRVAHHRATIVKHLSGVLFERRTDMR